MKILGIIPARLASTRFPEKPLVDIGGMSMIQRVYSQASKASSLHKVMVATDHQKIYDHVKKFSENVVMTSEHHQSGTDRCMEALALSDESFDFVINIQGDEPFIQPEQINLLAATLDKSTQLATLAKKIDTTDTLFNTNSPKLIFNKQMEAIYFSRHPIPFLRGKAPEEWLKYHDYYKHIGIYAYRSDILNQITKLPISPLEKAESLEQLRWVEHGYKIKIAITPLETIGIDTPEDLEKVRHLWNH